MSDITIDQQFIEYVVKTLVGKPEEVKIERTIDEKGVLLLLTVDPEDLGRVIGKRGATAQSMRTLLRALGTKNEARYNLKIVDNGYPKPDREERREDSKEDEPSDSRDDTKDVENKMQKPAKPSEEETSSESKVEESNVESLTSEEPESETETEVEVQEESAVERTRRELEDLDDLDI